ncbi:hypothetical protein A2165_01550 [Candidatus Curtissbacteria bacterium RBG_13_40_7]|uniref:histidine kinase n=1 Tax=Candidatus Curtissbacteria bacterium RBG_13_40_7 TaxID=1797706 RepID=A0A1F5FTR6_9BACT|nr:MAG: hypothetical protein A2165_01550 [Candidatus Curtissbacteria bacterium RBG_13_40_7]
MVALLLTLIILVIILVLGFVVFINNKNSLTNATFFIVTIFLVLWAIANFLENEKIDFIYRSLFLRFDFFLGLWVSFFWLLFCRVFLLDIKEFKKIKYGFLTLIPIILLSPLTFSGLIIKDITVSELGINFGFGILFILYALVIFGYLFGGLFLLLNKYRWFTGLKRIQTLYVLLGLSISATITLLMNLVLQNYISADIARFGIYGFIFIVGFTSYAILRYRLMDVRVIIRRSAVFAVLVLIITALYAILAYFLSQIFTDILGVSSLILNGVVMAILVALGFEPLKLWLSYVTDSFLFKAEYKPQEVLSQFSDQLTTTLDLSVITKFIVNKLGEVFKTNFVSLFLLNESSNVFQKAADWGKVKEQMPQIDEKLFSKVFKYLQSLNRERDIVVREEVKKANELLNNPILQLLIENLDKYEVNLIVPMYVRDKLIGLLFLADKKSGDVYSQQDFRILEIISSQSAVAMQNAQLFEEQKKFAVHLKHEVEKATKELRIANVQLKKLDRAKSEFISIASHQLRTPLTVIKGYLSMINQKDFGEIPEQIMNPLDKVYKSTQRIIGLVEDLLNISRIESGRMTFDFETVDLPELVKEVFEELEQHAKSKGLDFKYIQPVKKIPPVQLDRNKIREVLMNLMDNAIKYTEKGFVNVQLEKLDNHVRFAVKDSGRGIEPDEMPLLFQKFSRAKGVQLVHTEGTGLGLYIAKQILQKHHARIWAESEGSGKGSKFIIEFKI